MISPAATKTSHDFVAQPFQALTAPTQFTAGAVCGSVKVAVNTTLNAIHAEFCTHETLRQSLDRLSAQLARSLVMPLERINTQQDINGTKKYSIPELFLERLDVDRRNIVESEVDAIILNAEISGRLFFRNPKQMHGSAVDRVNALLRFFLCNGITPRAEFLASNDEFRARATALTQRNPDLTACHTILGEKLLLPSYKDGKITEISARTLGIAAWYKRWVSQERVDTSFLERISTNS